MQRPLGDIIKRKTHKNTTTCIIFWYGTGLKLYALTVETGKRMTGLLVLVLAQISIGRYRYPLIPASISGYPIPVSFERYWLPHLSLWAAHNTVCSAQTTT